MALNCPHCSKELPGYTTQEALEARVAQKGRDLEREIEPLRAKASGYDALKIEHDALGKKLAERESQIELRDVLGARGVTDPKVMRSISAIYGAETADLAEDKRPKLGDWLDADGKSHPVISGVLKPPPAPVAPAASTPAAPAPTGTVNPGGAGAAPPNSAPSSKMTPADVQKYLRSPEYRALPRAEQAKKLGELQAQVSAQQTAGPAV